MQPFSASLETIKSAGWIHYIIVTITKSSLFSTYLSGSSVNRSLRTHKTYSKLDLTIFFKKKIWSLRVVLGVKSKWLTFQIDWITNGNSISREKNPLTVRFVKLPNDSPSWRGLQAAATGLGAAAGIGDAVAGGGFGGAAGGFGAAGLGAAVKPWRARQEAAADGLWGCGIACGRKRSERGVREKCLTPPKLT